MGGIDPYLGLGQSASNIGFGQQQTGLNNLSSGLGQLSQLYSGGYGGGYGGYGGGYMQGPQNPSYGYGDLGPP